MRASCTSPPTPLLEKRRGGLVGDGWDEKGRLGLDKEEIMYYKR